MSKRRIAVIGAGAAGLCAARHLTTKPAQFDVVVFEKADRVGGTWVYTESVGLDEHGLPIHSSMYKSLKTNLPKEIMAFPDFPFDERLPSFIKHTDVLDYLQQYSDHFQLDNFIQFSTVVEMVRPIKSSDDSITWEITVSNLRTRHRTTSIFHQIMVCNGHYAIPNIPDLPGRDKFRGYQLHSHNYRHPDVFKDQKVVVLGGASSGLDIILDIAPHAKHVYLSHWKDRVVAPLPDNIEQAKEVVSFTQEDVVFADGEKCKPDAIIYCTGYNYDFSFLTPECQLTVDDRRIMPLYKHIIHTSFPSLAFIGITQKVLPFPHFTAQVKFVLASWIGTYQLPDQTEMDASTEEDFRWRTTTLKMPHRYAHFMGSIMREYHQDLLEMAKEHQFKPVLMDLYEEMYRIRRINLMHYKKLGFKVLDDENFQLLEVDTQ
nr:uncharacterized protein LOC129257731 [Lytechinus pictus]